MTEERIRELAREHEEAHSWDTTTREEMLVQFAHEIIAEERERCARVCELIEAEEWDKYKRGEPEYRADPYREGMSDGAGKCAAAIREGK